MRSNNNGKISTLQISLKRINVRDVMTLYLIYYLFNLNHSNMFLKCHQEYGQDVYDLLLSNIDQGCTDLASFQRETILLAFVYLDLD